MQPIRTRVSSDHPFALRKWAKETAQAARDREEPFNQDLHQQILAAWERERPQMWARLQQQEIADELARAVQSKMWEAETMYRRAGMMYTDARETAEREWLMLEPEADEDETPLL